MQVPLGEQLGGADNAVYSTGAMELEFDSQFFNSLTMRFGVDWAPGVDNPQPGGVDQILQDLVDYLAAYPKAVSVSITKSWSVGQVMTPTEEAE
jgi:hypothetical protein